QGLLIGQHYAFAGYGPLLMLLVTSPTVRDALNQVIRFQQLTHLTGQLALQQSEHHSALCYRAKQQDDHLGMLLAQAEISGTFKFIREIYKLMGLSKPDLRIELPFAYPEDLNTLKVYHDYYGTQVQFDARRAAYCIEESLQVIERHSLHPISFAIDAAKCLV